MPATSRGPIVEPNGSAAFRNCSSDRWMFVLSLLTAQISLCPLVRENAKHAKQAPPRSVHLLFRPPPSQFVHQLRPSTCFYVTETTSRPFDLRCGRTGSQRDITETSSTNQRSDQVSSKTRDLCCLLSSTWRESNCPETATSATAGSSPT